MKRATLWGLPAALVLSGCPAPPNDSPPPPRKPEIAVAPPRALGALAGGTEAAPRPEVGAPTGELFEPDVPPTAPGLPAPTAPAPAPEGSVAEPDPLAPADPHAPRAPAEPDAGMAL